MRRRLLAVFMLVGLPAPSLLAADGVAASAPASAPAIRWIARQGPAALADVDGARVCFLTGTPGQMGRQHGKLLGGQVRAVTQRVLSFVREHARVSDAPFGGRLDEVVARTSRFTPVECEQELRGLAEGAGLTFEEIRAANAFPELFNCSGFALLGKATRDGEVLHGRNLDYRTDLGLQDHAVVFVVRPEAGRAFISVGYAGFIGCVSGMNDRGISVGEMGADGHETDWDGLPMALLIREALQQASSLDKAVEVFRTAPRTRHYAYIIADGPRRQAAALDCTAGRCEVVRPGESSPDWNRPMPDTVLISSGERYVHLAQRVREKLGGFTPELAGGLMTRPVAMDCSLHCVPFRPASLDLWFANAADPTANPRFQACWQRYHHLNLKALLACGSNLHAVSGPAAASRRGQPKQQ